MRRHYKSNWQPRLLLAVLAWITLPSDFAQAPSPRRLSITDSGKDPQSYPPDVRRQTPDEESRELFLLKMADDSEHATDTSNADQYWHDVIALAEATWGPKHPFTAAVLSRFAGVLDERGRYLEAEPLYRRALTIRRARLDADDASIANVLDRLAVNLTLQGHIVEAEPYFRDALSSRDRPNANQAILAITLNNLGRDLNDQGLAEKAQYRQLQAQGDRTTAPAVLQNSERHLKEAESVLRRALNITENISGPNSDDTVASLENLAGNLESQGRTSDADLLTMRAKSVKASRSDAVPTPATERSVESVSGRQATTSSIPPDIRRWTQEEEATVQRTVFTAREYEADGDFRTAENFLRKRLEICESTWGPGHPMTARALIALGNNLNHQGRFAEAEVVYRRALNIDENREGVELSDIALDAGNLATSLNSLGKFDESEALLRKALDIDQRLSPASDRSAGDLNNLGVTLDFQGRYSEAEPFFRRALSVIQARSGAAEPRVAENLNNLAYNLDAQSRYAEAEPYYRRALWIFQANPRKQSDIAMALDNLGVNLDGQKRHIEAEAYHREGLRVFEGSVGPSHPDFAAAINNLAANLDAQSRHTEAEQFLTRALKTNTDRLGPSHPTTAASLVNLALAELRLYRYPPALMYAERALSIRQTMQTDLNPSAASARSAAVRRAVGSAALLYARAAWGRHKTIPALTDLRARAFEAVQMIRVSSSADALAAGSARAAAERYGAGSIVDKWRATQTELGRIDHDISAAAGLGTAGDVRRTALSTERVATWNRLLGTETDLITHFPRYFDLLEPQPVSIADLQSTSSENGAPLLRDNEVLILLTPGDSRMPEGNRNGLIFAVTQTSAAWAELRLSPEDLRNRVRELHDQLEHGGATATSDRQPTGKAFDRRAAFAVYNAIFGDPAIQALVSTKDRWILAPQGSLLSLPFAALVMRVPRQGQAGDYDPRTLRATAWLGLRKTLTLIPSVSSLRIQRRLAADQSNTDRAPFFGVGDPAFTGRPDGTSCDASVRSAHLKDAKSYFRGSVADVEALHALPCLPNSGPEIRSLAESLHAGPESYLLQLDATETELRHRNLDGRLKRVEIVAFATHGLVAGDLANSLVEPALALTPPDLPRGQMPPSDNDGLLTASEVATLELSARFVVLSACNTAAGKSDDDGLSGLARAFFYAGAQSLLVSHFAVFDNAAMRLTTDTIRYSKEEHLHSPEALRKAMISLVQDRSMDRYGASYAHPSQWAPFLVIDAF
jgi:CHAT domain-containing protein/tetratricopeptide (TPR) repeat protein